MDIASASYSCQKSEKLVFGQSILCGCSHHGKDFYSGTLTGVFDSKVSLLSQWGINAARELGAVVCLSPSALLEAVDSAVMISRGDDPRSKELFVGVQWIATTRESSH